MNKENAFRSGKVFYKEVFAGRLWSDEDGYWFQYDQAYLEAGGHPISLKMSLQAEAYQDNKLHAFFDNLIPEGWLLQVSTEVFNLSAKDRLSLLLAVGEDTIGAVSVKPE